ncbi:thioredoxin domain-containing protein, partial [Candidatus Woesearchaeota archaeon]|nr:thioredoxin domain-containing protein [Candidatus Woesearchaeota archaeon]
AQSGVYKLKLDISGEEYNSYITKDGELFFISGIDLTEAEETTEESDTESQATGFDALDQETPTIDLFVMSFCPYGQQAINNIAPAIELLNEEIQFTPHYIVSMDDGIVTSLHGSKEADEDMRQACIWKYYTENYWDYVLYVNKNIPLNNINEKWTEAAENIGLDIESIETCVEEEGVELMKAESELTGELGVSGSPTLIINGERYSGERTPEAFKQAICSGFGEQPEVCSETLEEGTAADGSC